MAALQIPERDIDRAQGFDRQAFLAMVAQPVVQIRPMPLGSKRVLADQQLLVVFDDWRSQPGRAEGFAPAAVAILADDLDQTGLAPLVPGLRVGERLGQRGFEYIGFDVADFENVAQTLSSS